MSAGARRRLVLVGAGHTHVEVLRRWAETPPPSDVDTVLVTDREQAAYSGMVPGFLAGDYRLEEAQIPVLPLAEQAGAELVLSAARRVDPERRIVETEDGRILAFDFASLDVGSTVRGLELPGVREHALATRPIGDFAEAIEARAAALATGAACRIAVVGGGAAGVEIAFTLEARLAGRGVKTELFVVCGRDGLLPSYSERARSLAMREAAARGIQVAATSDVCAVDAGGVVFEKGRLQAEHVVWATGAASPAVVADSPLPHDAKGFVRVHATLEVVGVRGLFAVGDCASIAGADWVPKAGVYAVREGPVLEANLRAALAGAPLRSFEPQRHILSLMNLGHRRALASKWGLAATGRAMWLWKDRIDRAFVEKYRVRAKPLYATSPAAAQRR